MQQNQEKLLNGSNLIDDGMMDILYVFLIRKKHVYYKNAEVAMSGLFLI